MKLSCLCCDKLDPVCITAWGYVKDNRFKVKISLLLLFSRSLAFPTQFRSFPDFIRIVKGNRDFATIRNLRSSILIVHATRVYGYLCEISSVARHNNVVDSIASLKIIKTRAIAMTWTTNESANTRSQFDEFNRSRARFYHSHFCAAITKRTSAVQRVWLNLQLLLCDNRISPKNFSLA